MTVSFALHLGAAKAELLRRGGVSSPHILVGTDTRRSGPMLAHAAAAGMASRGAQVTLLGVVPTPGVSYLTNTLGADAGLMVSASHNPYADNGLKLFGHSGAKLTDEEEASLEALVASLLEGEELPPITGEDVGGVTQSSSAPVGKGSHLDLYFEHLLNNAPYLDGLRVALDCGNGAAYEIAPAVFRKLGARLEVLNAVPDGTNVNHESGSTHPEALARRVVEGGFDVGVTFDGDADRALLVDSTGRIVSGDHIVAIAALWRGESEVVVTQMTNLGVEDFLKENGVTLHRTAVGDRYVMEELAKRGLALGGEQSGHVLFLDKAPTGDGVLTALQALAAVRSSQRALSDWLDEIPVYPQLLLNVEVPLELRGSLTTHAAVAEAVVRAESLLEGVGRLLLRPSGTEPLVRVMVEGKEGEVVETAAEMVAAAVRSAAAAEQG